MVTPNTVAPPNVPHPHPYHILTNIKFIIPFTTIYIHFLLQSLVKCGMFFQYLVFINFYQIYELVSMATEFFMVHGISERKYIILRKLRFRILKYILHRYINSNNFRKKENYFKVLWPQNSNKTLQHCKGA